MEDSRATLTPAASDRGTTVLNHGAPTHGRGPARSDRDAVEAVGGITETRAAPQSASPDASPRRASVSHFVPLPDLPNPAEANSVRFWFTRQRRVLLLLVAVWVISLFDLSFTLDQRNTQEFVELNPLAAAILNGPAYRVVLFKFFFLSLGTTILMILRRHSVAELACWFLLGTKFHLAVRWYFYFNSLWNGTVDPFVAA